jgi:O-antigen/teichoic acid export membrane protein
MVGLLVMTAGGYGFLTVAARSLPPDQFSAVATLWSLVWALGPGLFGPVEAETTRVVAERRARGEPVGPALARVLAVGGLLGVFVLGLLAAGSGVLTRAVLGGQAAFVPALAVTLAAMACLHVTRGVLAGSRRYRVYGAQLALEGLMRLVGAAAVVAWAGGATSFAAVMAAAPLAALVLTLPLLSRYERVRPRTGPWREVGAGMGWLVVAGVMSQTLANAGPVVLPLIEREDPTLAGRFLAAFLLVRAPLLLTGPLQATVLPHLVQSWARGEAQGFRRSLRAALLVVGGLGCLGLLGLSVVGPWLLVTFFGPAYDVGRVPLVLLGLSSVVFLLAGLLQSAVLAVGRHRRVAVAWSVGGAVFAGCCLLPLEPLRRMETAYLASSCIVGLLLLGALRRGPVGSASGTSV